jgi:hypothetical protein
MGAATSLRMTRTTFFGLLFTYAVPESTYGQPITYLMGGSLVEVHSCTRRVIFVYPTRAHSLVAAHPAATQRTGAVWALVVELDPAPPRCPSES